MSAWIDISELSSQVLSSLNRGKVLCRPEGAQGLDELQIGVHLEVVGAARGRHAVARHKRPQQALVIRVQQAPSTVRLACTCSHPLITRISATYMASLLA